MLLVRIEIWDLRWRWWIKQRFRGGTGGNDGVGGPAVEAVVVQVLLCMIV